MTAIRQALISRLDRLDAGLSDFDFDGSLGEYSKLMDELRELVDRLPEDAAMIMVPDQSGKT
jgi:hypothetical protein